MTDWPQDLAKWADEVTKDEDGGYAIAKSASSGLGKGYAAAEPIRSPVKYMGTYRHISGPLLSQLPEHKVYVEPFAGPGDFFFARAPMGIEVVNDKDPRLIKIWRFLKGASDADFARLKRMNWTLTKGTFADVKASIPTSSLGWFYKVAYMTHFALMAQPVMRSEKFTAGVPATARLGKTLEWEDRLEKMRARLRKVTILCEDYRTIYKRYGGRSDALFFIDPPYPSTTQYYREASVDFEDLGRRTKALKGKWVVLYEATPHWKVFKGPGVERTRFQRSKRAGIIWSKDPARRAQQEASYDPNGRMAYIITNVGGYGRKVTGQINKAAGEALVGEIFSGAGELLKRSGKPLEEVPIWKAEGDEQIVFGEVLIPEDRDLQGDIYSEKEVEAAAYAYLSDYRRGKLGEQHESRLVDEVSLLESYVAPVDMTINGRKIRKGTWLMRWKVHCSKLWGKIKRGEITGFSIGGSASQSPG